MEANMLVQNKLSKSQIFANSLHRPVSFDQSLEKNKIKENRKALEIVKPMIFDIIII